MTSANYAPRVQRRVHKNISGKKLITTQSQKGAINWENFVILRNEKINLQKFEEN